MPVHVEKRSGSRPWKIVEKSGNDVIGRVGTNVEYAIPLEYGTSKMAARPFMRPMLENDKKKIARILGSK